MEEKIASNNGPSPLIWDNKNDYKEIKTGEPKIQSISSLSESGLAIVSNITNGTFNSEWNKEFDLVLRYCPNHFSWGGCYNHYFLKGKFMGEITKTDTKTMYSKELETKSRWISWEDYLRDTQINEFKPLIKTLESKLEKDILKNEELEKIMR